MRRFGIGLASFILTLGCAQAQQAAYDQLNDDRGPSVAHAIPLSYVGGSGRISIGIDQDGNSTGEALGVFDNTGEHAYIGQLWWGHGGAGGVQFGYNWLWGGMTLSQAQEQPDRVTVARSMIALDQNEFKDRKATFGFGIERPNYSLDAYLSMAASGSRAAGARSIATPNLLSGSDELGSFNQLETVITTDSFATRSYDTGIGFRASHFSDPLGLRVYAGLDYQHGKGGARVFTVSTGIDKLLGTRGWSMSGQVEHDEMSTDPLLGVSSDTRGMFYLRYEFGGRVFVPTSELTSPAWISRALVSPPPQHPRIVRTYTRRTGSTTTREVGPKEYTNLYPTARNDSLSLVVDSPPALIDVLANDTDPDGDLLSIVAVTPPQHGSATITGGAILYTPEAGYIGSDGFGYTISDGSSTASADVQITISARPNQSPIARDDNARTSDGVPLTINVLANDSDPDGDSLQLVSLTQPGHGSAAISGEHVIYTPEPGYSGGDQFSYTLSDGQGGSATATVFIVVDPQPNRPPVAVDDSAFLASTQTDIAIAVLTNDFDADGDALSVIAVSQGQYGNVVILPDQSVRYTLMAGRPTTADQFSYTISDGRGGTASARVNVRFNATINRAPIARDDRATTQVDTPVSIDVLANDSDPDGDSITVASVDTPSHGSASRASDGTVTYTPDVGFVGSDRFTYVTRDSDGRMSMRATVYVMVQALVANQPPVAVDDSATLVAGTSQDIDVLANDSDADGDPLSVIAVTQGTLGSTTILPDGRIRYTSMGATATGTDQFSYTISDGRGGTASAMVAVTVVPVVVNQAPIAVDDSATLVAGTSQDIDVLANDSDADGDPLSVIAVTPGTLGSTTILPDGRIRYTSSDPAGVGTDQFSYTISDGRGGTASAMVAVTVVPVVVNQAPIAVDDSATLVAGTSQDIDVLANDSDADGDPLSVIAVTPGTLGSTTILPDGRIRYTSSDPAGVGTDQFSYTISDGRGGTASAMVAVTVVPVVVNQPPIAVDDIATIAHGAVSVVIPVLDNDSDPDGDPLSVISTSLPSSGVVTILADGRLSYERTDFGTPMAPDRFSYTISDGQGHTASAMVAVNPPLNFAPIAVDDSYIMDLGAGNAMYLDVLYNDSDPDGDPLEIIAATSPDPRGIVNIDGGTRLLFVAIEAGTYVVTYTISDGYGGIATATATINAHN